MRGNKLMRRAGILVLAPALGEHIFLLRLQHRKTPDLSEITSKPAFTLKSLARQHSLHLLLRDPYVSQSPLAASNAGHAFGNIDAATVAERGLGKAVGLKISNITQRKGFKLYDTKHSLPLKLRRLRARRYILR